ncbi:MAG: UMP kinase, partial [Candidatus Saccharibacteria bacterium]
MPVPKNKRYIISLGGSLIVPDQIDVGFLKSFRKIVEDNIRSGKKFLIITGGGKTARRYAEAARTLGVLHSNDLDWLGIHATRINGHLMRTIFRKIAYKKIITDPDEFKVPEKFPVIVAAGYEPGCSTDYVAVILAKRYSAHSLLNLSNIDYVYDKDPKKFADAKKMPRMTWKEFRKLVGNRWDPGL